jgi:uncharacterized protein (DUF58 family)
MPRPAGAPRRFRLPRRLRVTNEGKAFILITIGVGAAAINTGNNLLYLALSMNLSLIVVSGFLSEWTLRRVSLSVRPVSDAFAGEEGFLAVTCSAAGKRFPAVSLSARLRLDGETVTVRFPDIAARGSATRVVPFHPVRRGRTETAEGTLSTRFPFSLFEKSADMDLPADLFVFPRPLPPERLRRGNLETRTAGNPRLSGRSGAFLRGAREHLPADPVRDIHWKASARMGRWMVKEREAETASTVDLRVPVPCAAEEFETLLSEACGAVIDLERREIPYRLWIGDRMCADAREAGNRYAALTALATARGDGGPTSPGKMDL